jgi:hypothetical protein
MHIDSHVVSGILSLSLIPAPLFGDTQALIPAPAKTPESSFRQHRRSFLLIQQLLLNLYIG